MNDHEPSVAVPVDVPGFRLFVRTTGRKATLQHMDDSPYMAHFELTARQAWNLAEALRAAALMITDAGRQPANH